MRWLRLLRRSRRRLLRWLGVWGTIAVGILGVGRVNGHGGSASTGGGSGSGAVVNVSFVSSDFVEKIIQTLVQLVEGESSASVGSNGIKDSQVVDVVKISGLVGAIAVG